MEVSLNHTFQLFFSFINHPAIGVPPHDRNLPNKDFTNEEWMCISKHEYTIGYMHSDCGYLWMFIIGI